MQMRIETFAFFFAFVMKLGSLKSWNIKKMRLKTLVFKES